MSRVIVLDKRGVQLSPCSLDKAKRLLALGQATVVQDEPLTIRLAYAVDLPPSPQTESKPPIGAGQRLLLHICCGPCATYSISRLRAEGFEVWGFWYNPNVHPYGEHEKRREAIASYAETVGLPMIWHENYEMVEFLRAVAGHERFRERCAICYRLRLAKTAQVAAERGFQAITTTLLISPYQDQRLIREIGEEEARQKGLSFHFENLRRGWAERGRLAREHHLYQQRYCGCIYSEWEALSRGHEPQAALES